MKKWSFVVASLYGLVLAILTIPVWWIAFFPKSLAGSKPQEILFFWQFWAIIVAMALAQFALLRIPVHIANKRPVPQRPVIVTILAASLMMGLLVFGAAEALYEWINKLGPNPIVPWALLGLASWVFWAIYFYVSTRKVSPEAKVTKLRRFLWTGSILELLVAVPTHIVARQREDCCAGMLTFIGLVCGLSVMLFAFGPAVYFLFVARWRRLHPERAGE